MPKIKQFFTEIQSYLTGSESLWNSEITSQITEK